MESERAEFNSNHVCSLVENNISQSSLNTVTNTDLSRFTVAEQTISAWVYWLGSDLVSQWRTLPIESWSLATIFEQLNPQLYCANSLLLTVLGQSKTSSGELVAELNIGYQEIYQQQKYLINNGTLKWLIH